MAHLTLMPRLRGLLIALILVGCVWAVAWAAASSVAPRRVSEAMPQLEERMARAGIGIGELSFSAIHVSPWLNGVALSDLTAGLDLNPRDRVPMRSNVVIQRIDIMLTDPLRLRGSLLADGLEVSLDVSDRLTGLPFDRFTNARLAVGDLPLVPPLATAEAIRGKLRELFVDNKASGDVAFSGDVVVDVQGLDLVAHLYTEQIGDRFQLRFRASDIQAISDQKGMGLVPEQVEIVALYPLRAPVILLVTDQARTLAKTHEPDDIWLQDAHRHVTWSFLLTRFFGSEFATMVTDAQEMRPGNTSNERAMDFHNNAMGRQLFENHIALAALPGRVREDPQIIRHPDEVERFGQGRLLR